MTAAVHTTRMLDWWRLAGVDRADLAVRRRDGTMLWHHDRPLADLPLPWARAENVRHAEVYVRPARGRAWPLLFLDDVDPKLARRIARKYSALLVQTSIAGGCHVWLAAFSQLDERERAHHQRHLAELIGADLASTSGEHLGRLAGFKNWKRQGEWVNVLAVSQQHRLWIPPATNRPVHRRRPPDSNRTSPTIDTSDSGREWGWVCGALQAGLPLDRVAQQLLQRARERGRHDAERYATRTVERAALRAQLSTPRRGRRVVHSET